MSKALPITTTVWAILTLAPWAVFLAGVAKLTASVNSNSSQTWERQYSYMLEWFEVWFELLIIIVVAALAFLHPRSGSFLQMWLATITALIIYSATQRIININAIRSGDGAFTNATPYASYGRKDLPGLRCITAGLITTAFMNFIMSILIGIHGGQAVKHNNNPMQHTSGKNVPTGHVGHQGETVTVAHGVHGGHLGPDRMVGATAV